MDPFHAECRAFARLREVGRERLAVQVHGYVALTMTGDVLEKIGHAMAKTGKWSDEEVADPLGALYVEEPADGSWCLMGILKDWISPPHSEEADEDLQGLVLRGLASKFRRMFADLKQIHKSGIVVTDVKIDQWVDGTLVDLSSAMTVPHMYGPEGLYCRPWWTFASLAEYDLLCFQTKVIDFWNEIPWSEWFPDLTSPRLAGSARSGLTTPGARPRLAAVFGLARNNTGRSSPCWDRLRIAVFHAHLDGIRPSSTGGRSVRVQDGRGQGGGHRSNKDRVRI